MAYTSNDELGVYPSTERAITGGTKVFFAVISGGSTLASFFALAAVVSHITAGAFAIGGLVYAVKAIRDARKRRQEEIRLTEKYNDNLEKLRRLFTPQFVLTLNRVITLAQSGQLNNHETECLFMHLLEIKKLLMIVYPDPQMRPIYTQLVDDGFQAVKTKVGQIRGLAENQACLPDVTHKAIVFEEVPPKNEPVSIVRIIKQGGNRLLSFMGGASSGIGIASTIATLGFGIATPGGWVMAGMIITGFVVGVLAMVADYYLCRRENKKIKLLEQRCRELAGMSTGFHIVQQSLGKICDHAEERAATKNELTRLQAENAQLKCKLNTNKAENAPVNSPDSIVRSDQSLLRFV